MMSNNVSRKLLRTPASLQPHIVSSSKIRRAQPKRAFTESVQQPTVAPNQELFRYTSGRWLFNEHLRLSERFLEFDVTALQNVVASASGHSISDLQAFTKLAEGGYNRVFEATFSNGETVIARLPYPSTVPEHYTLASEAATLDYLRLQGIRTPEVYAWCGTKANPVGAEYIVMERLEGIPLGERWYALTPKEHHKIMKQIVEWETRLMSLQFPASGSLYYTQDLSPERRVQLPASNLNGKPFCIGPIAHYSWWHDRRDHLDIDRGPWQSSIEVFRAAGERELAWTKAYAKPRLPYERLYREIYGFQRVSPDSHIADLTNYLKLAPSLGFPADSQLNRPVMRHPDLRPNNILMSDSNEIVGLIDWQHCSILSLGVVAGIPAHFQNYGDPESEMLKRPQLNLPPDYDSLPPSEQASIRETHRKRLIHFLYAALTKRFNEVHYDAIFDQSTILRQRLLEGAGTPWEGDSVSLQAELIRSIQNWPAITGSDSAVQVSYPADVVQENLALDARQKEADAVMDETRSALGVDVLGWVPNEDYDAAKAVAQDLKTKMLEAAETHEEVVGVRDHFPFDDFDESA